MNMNIKNLHLIDHSYYTGRPVRIQFLDKSSNLNVIFCNVIEINEDNFEVVYLNHTIDRGWKAITEIIPFSEVCKVFY